MTTKPVAAELLLSLVLTTRAGRDVLAFIEEPDAASLRDAEVRELAEARLGTLLGGQRYAVYVRNNGGGEGDDLVVEIRLATDVGTDTSEAAAALSSVANGALLKKLGGKTLVFVGKTADSTHSGQPQFLLMGARLAPEARGFKDAWSLPTRAILEVGDPNPQKTYGFSARLLTAIRRLPEPRAQRESIQKRLGEWNQYLGVLERTAKARQFVVSYTSWQRSANLRQLTFTLVGEIPWDKLRAALNETVEVLETPTGNAADPENWDDDAYPLGQLVELNQERRELRLLLDDEDVALLERRRWNLPNRAALCYRASGDLAQIRRYKYGLEALEQGHAENPRLSEFLFDATQARRPDKVVPIRQDQLLQPSLNPGQLAAVTGAVNAPDLFLIQGPPGTGKTTVIAEICYQNALRGQRTLIASQANLAVDHALSKLLHHPTLRVLRRGRADRVEVEGAPFLEENVVGTWLAKTATGCENDLAARRERIEQFEQLLTHRATLDQLAGYAVSYQAERPALAERVSALEKMHGSAAQRAQQLVEALEQRRAAFANPEQNLRAFGDHPLLEQYRDDVRELERAVTAWTGETRPPRRAANQSIFDRAAIAMRTYGLIASQTDTIRQRLGYVEQAVRAWYNAYGQLQAVGDTLEDVRQTLLAHRARQTALSAQLQALEADLATFDQLPERLPAMRPALEHWLTNLTQRMDLTPLPEFTGSVGRALWNEACTAAHVYKFAGQAQELQTARTEAARFGQLASQLNATAETLAAEVTPEVLERAGHRRLHWLTSGLSALVARDAHGALHPANQGSGAWRAITDELRALRQRPTGWRAWLPDERRQLHVARWVLWLRAAADDFGKRQGELRGQMDSHAARLPEKLPALTDALQAALLQLAATLGAQYHQQRDTLVSDLAAAADSIRATTTRLGELQIQEQALQAHLNDLVQRIASDAEELNAANGGEEDTDPTKLLQPVPRFSYDASPLTQKVGTVPAAQWFTEWQAAVAEFDASRAQLAERAKRLDSATLMEALLADAAPELQRLDANAAKAAQARDSYATELATAQEALQQAETEYTETLAWWLKWHAVIPANLLPKLLAEVPIATRVTHPDYIAAVAASSAQWAAALAGEQTALARREDFVRAWIDRLRAPAPPDVADLHQIYIDNANVIGITCAQAGAYQFSREYRNFDCVIIDEVSKATPPELLLPMLKGRRVVLVGDHKQLPPMLGPETLAELAAEMGVEREAVAHLEKALFQELFEQAPTDVRVMLTAQYRMHPQIMGAINQFYAEQLVCGLPHPDTQRAHGLSLPAIKPEHHIVWIATPNEAAHFEQRAGTSYHNPTEVDLIERLVMELDQAWAAPVAAGQPPKEIGIITFYSAQLRVLRERLLNRAEPFAHLKLRVGTVDRFQGMERPIIIVSLVRNNANGNVGFAQKPERVNVAFSRAQELLVIVGSRELFAAQAKDTEATAIYSRVAEVVKQAGGMRRLAGK